MSPLTWGYIGLAAMVFLMFCGMPIGFAMGLVGLVGFAILVGTGAAVQLSALTAYHCIMDYGFLIFPLFFLMAQLFFEGGFGASLYRVAHKWLGHFPGGLALATTGACAIFAAISASTLATAMTMGLVAMPEMKKYNYDPSLAAGTVAAGGTLGIMIPPSGIIIIYGILTGESIAELLIAGIIPGILLAFMMMVLIYTRVRINPALGPRGPKVGFKEKVVALGGMGEVVLLIFLVLGGILLGWFTPTEAGAVGAFGALVICITRRRISWKSFRASIVETLLGVGAIYLLLIGAFIFNNFLARSTVPMMLANMIGGFDIPPLAVAGAMVVLYLILGCLISSVAMILLTIPIFFPIIVSLGLNPIWFGIVIVTMCEVGAITPPVGLNVYVLSSVARDIPIEVMFKGIFPFLIVFIIFIVLIFLFQDIVLFLPGLMRG